MGESFTDVISIGIGGSALGTQFVNEAFRHNHSYHSECNLNVHFLSNVDPASFVHIVGKLNATRTLVVLVSKSFTTAETL